MTNQPPPNPQSSSDDDLGFDDLIGILVAFLTIGTVLFWSLSRKESNWNVSNLFSKVPVANKAPAQSDANNNLTNLLVPSPEPNNTLESRQPVAEAEPTRKNPNPIFLERETADAVIPALLVPQPGREVPPDYDKVTGDSSNKTANVAGDAKPDATNTPVAVNTPTPTQTPTPTPTQTPSVQAKATKLPTIPPPIAFTDVRADYWAKPFIDKLSSRKFIEGYNDNSYKPEQPVNRAEFAAVINKAFETDLTNTQKEFEDIKNDFWAQQPIKQAVDKKFMTGYPGNVFKPEQKIPRVEVIVSLVSGLDKVLKTPASQKEALSVYKDADQIPEWAREKVAIATANNLIVNYPDQNLFQPKKEATRAEVATMIHQALVKMDKVEPIKSQYVVGQ